MTVTNLGCRILALYTKDRKGSWENIVLALKDPERDYEKDRQYLGAVIGRVANRIGGSQFHLNGEEYRLTPSAGENHLHGGKDGFHNRLFKYEILESGVRFSYVSPDGEEGYPGRLWFQTSYILEENRLHILYEAESDADTLINPTNHTYFNLTGCRESILHHQLRIEADRIAEIDKNGLPTGKFMDVAGTPFDFRTPREIGERIGEGHPQLQNGNGYDHPYILSRPGGEIVLSEETTGREVELSSDMPTVQFYSGNGLSGGCVGAIGRPYKSREGVALETQFLPDSVNLEKNSPTILRRGVSFRSETVYRFNAK